tara:strand:- start:7311 stop:9293 length:1983 start_codon:yes stop_codon:yes gene_type:complete
MALTTGNIDQQIRDKVDSGRSNPAKLQNEYKLTKSLVSLLALQALESATKEEEKRKNLSMESNPGTIAEQRFNTAAKRKEKEVIEGVGGVAQQLQAQQMSALPNQMGGVASQPAPNMRMAGGGIVSFAPGGVYQTPNFSNTRDQFEQNRAFEAQYIEENEAELGGPSGLIPQEFRSPMATEQELAARVGLSIEDFKKLPFKTREAINRQIATLPNPTTQNELGQAANLKQAAAKKLNDIVSKGYTSPDELNRRAATLAPAVEVNKAGDVSAGMSAPGPNFNFETGQPMPPAGSIPSAVATRGFSPVVAEELDPDQIQMGTPTTYKGQGIDAARKTTVADNTKKAQDLSLAQANRDPLEEMKAKQLQVDKFQNRKGIATLRGEQTDRVEAQGEKAKEDRKNNRFYNLLSRAGGQGALANIGRADTDLKASDAAFEKIELADVLTREDKGVSDDLSISGRSITSGDKAFEMGEAAKSAGLKNLSNLAKTEADNLTKDALGFLQADSANLTEEARYRRDLIGVLSTNVNNKLKADIANMQGALEKETNSIRSMIGKAQSRTSYVEVLDKIENNIGSIREKYDKTLVDLLLKDTRLMKLRLSKDPEDIEAAVKLDESIRASAKALSDANLKEYNNLAAYVRKLMIGGGSGSGSPAVVLGSRTKP